MHKLEVNMVFQTRNRAQAELIAKELRKVRRKASNLEISESSHMNTTIKKETEDGIS